MYGIIAFQSTGPLNVWGKRLSVSLGRLEQNLVKLSDVVVDRSDLHLNVRA